MDQASPTANQSQPDHVAWEDIEDIARRLFHVWDDGADLAWAKTAWQALSQAGMTAYASEAERTICVVRLIALSALYREFCVQAFEEGEPDGWQEETDDLVGDYPKLDAFTIGQLAERHQINVDNSPLYESDPPALPLVVMQLVRDEYRHVVKSLQEQWGESALFTSLFVSAEPDNEEDEDWEEDDREDKSTSPVTEYQIDRVINYDLGSSKQRAHAWFTQGLPL